MKRRGFLKRGSGLVAIPVVAVSGNVYGTPAALARGAQSTPADGLLRLSLTSAGTPVEIQDLLVRLAAFWRELDAGGPAAATFATDPEAALRQFGLQGTIAADDPVMTLTRAVADPALRQAARTMDYLTFLRELSRRGVIRTLDYSPLIRRLRDVIAADHESFVRAFERLASGEPRLRDLIDRADRLNALLSSAESQRCATALTPPFGAAAASLPPDAPTRAQVAPQCSVAAAACLAYVAVGVYVYAGVAAHAAVVLNLALIASIATQIGVFVNQPRNAPMSGEEQVQRDLRRAATAAELLGRRDLAVETVRRAVDAQLEGIVSAATDMGLLRISEAQRADFMRQLRRLGYEAAGV